MNAVEMITRCAQHQNPEISAPESLTTGWEDAHPTVPESTLPDLPAAERGQVEGYVPLDFVSGLT